MANTLIRIGYISGTGGGGAISQYPDFASFPPVGSTNGLYYAADTGKLYIWNGTAYEEASPSLVTSVNTEVGDVVLDKADIGLDQVDNTSDADKPISDATQDALDLITNVNWTGDYNNGVTYAVGDGVMYNGASFRMINFIGAAGYPPPAYPGSWLQVTDYVSPNDIGLSNVDNTSDLDKPISNDTQDALDLKYDASNPDNYITLAEVPAAPVTSVSSRTGDVTLYKYDVGLSQVDNTSDADKPISDATQTALDGKADTVHNHDLSALNQSSATNGQVPTWNGTNWVPASPATVITDHGNLTGLADDDHTQYHNDARGDARYYTKTQIDNTLDASTYYHELHVNFDYTGGGSDGSPDKPYITIQSAVNAAQLQNVGGNTAILIHLKKDITMTENVVVNNAVSNLYITAAVPSNIDACPIKIVGSLTITGSQTNRVRVKDIQFAPTSGYALIIDGSNGRHMFQNCQFTNGSLYGQAGTGVNFTGIYKNFTEFVDCTIEGVVNIAGTPSALTTIAMYRCRLGYATVIANAANVSIGMYDTYGIYGITHSAGSLAITGMWGFSPSGFFNSTASLAATSFLSLANMSLQRYDLSFVTFNKTGTCYFQLINVHRNEAVDVLGGVRWVYGPTSTDSSYKYAVPGNWTSNPMNVASALDQLAANKIATSQKGAANGVAPLNASSKIDSTYLPAYVDDVLEYANLASFPVTGSTGIIYVALNTNLCYRWSGSAYIEISPAPVTSVNGQTNAVSLDASDIPFTPTATITSTDVQAAIEEVEANSAASTAAIFEDTREPTGFINRTDSTISFVDGTRIFTIAPVSTSFSFYIKGEKFTKTTAQSITIPNLTGTHYIYFNTSGALETTQVPSADLFQIDAIIAIVYWNNETNLSTLFGEERHGITMDGATHSYLHTILGARYLSGLALQNFTIGSGNSDADAQFTSDEGSIRDEDILHTIPAQTQMPILYRQGQYWRKKVADAYPLIYSGSAGYTGANGRPAYNEYTGGAWQLTQMSNTNFILVHFFGTNDVNNKVIGVVGTQQYNNITAARTGANSEISNLQDLPFAEFVPIGSVIFQSNNYSNAVKARVVQTDLGENYVDFRGTQVYTPAGQASDHGLLSGLVDDDHIQYHTDARGDIRYYTKAEVDSLVSGASSPGDIDETSFNINNSQAIAANITGLAFSNAVVRSFEVYASIYINATSSLYEEIKISGIQKGSDWDIAVTSVGDESGIQFSITSSGQLKYTSSNYSGFVSGTIKFRALTTSI
jgi:hypothetical protein